MTEIINQTELKGEQLAEGLLGQRPQRRGDIVEGTVVALDQEGAWVNIGAKSEAIVPTHEMKTISPLRPLQVGERVLVYMLQTERKDGRAVVSLDQARRFRGWRELEAHLASGELVEAEVISANRGGLVVSYEGIQGFIPSSQVAGPREENVEEAQRRLAQRQGELVKAKVIELNRQRYRLIFSERIALREQRVRDRERVLSELKEGEIRQGRVTGVHPFGVFVDLGGVEGLVPLSELSWQRDKTPSEIASTGEEVKVQVVKVDREAKRIVLSLRRTQPHPWDGVQEKYQVGQRVTATVTKLVPFGAFARLDGSIDGLIHISELSSRHIAHPKEVVREGDVLELQVLSIDQERRHLRLSLRQAQEEF